ncbi:autotransporter outer membrane beta-barrel domain-containing protein [Bartonella quintana]|uniref:autotransporter outer membrane beta-barrel domain-containing protein n=1 Tax=Bartonella quintana TaxID=803 RepID=UPI0005B35EA6|nr:autotransporter outer membrane beta-barrel domain-containing protein [Bartonella quintana]
MIIRVSKNRLYSRVFTAAIFFFLSNMNVEARSPSSVSLSCGGEKLPYRCSDGAKHTIIDKVYNFVGSSEEKNGSDDFFISSAVIVAQEPNTVIQVIRLKVEGTVGVEEDTYGVVASRGGSVILSDSIFKNVSTALRAESGTIEMNRGSIKSSQAGVYAEKQGASVVLTNVKIKVEGQDVGQEAALLSDVGADIKMMGGSIDVMDAAALYVGTRGSATLDSVTLTAKSQKNANKEDGFPYAVLNVNPYGSISLKNTNVTAAGVRALWMGLDVNAQLSIGRERNILVSRVNIEDSTITVIGSKHGMHFDMDKGNNEYKQGIVFLKKATFEVLDGVAIHSEKSNGYIAVTAGTKISGDLLLTAEKRSSVVILANSSLLTGGTRVADDSVAELYLTGGTKWVLTKSKKINQQVSNHVISSISFVRLSDSVIAFETPMFQEYQTLHIGKGGEEVYSAQDSASLYLNTYLNDDGSLNNQKTDRLLIHGDVSGKTAVYVQFVAGNQGKVVDDENAQSISIIQVSGKAAEDSFQLNSAYIALEGLPYQYYLHAYGPSSSRGNAQTAQRLVKGDGDFWDFRLESKYIQPTSTTSIVADSELRIRDVVPQVPTYLLLPNAFFHAGLVDISNQNEQLKTMQSVFGKLLKIDETAALFVHCYGGSYLYISDLSALEYGYGGNFDYNALKVGILLKRAESAYGITSFGLVGTHGKLSLQPRDVAHSQKSTFNKWSVTAYSSIEHDVGFYMHSLLSYGLFEGDILTLTRGKTAKLKANPLNISLSAGKAFITRYEGLIFDPQVQLIYQNLQFHKARDIDGFDIAMGKSDQWIMRVGAHFIKTLAESEKDRVISFYSKLHFVNYSGGKQFVHFKDAFQLGSFGSSLEVGLGFNSQLSQKIALHSDLIYQHKLTKAGFSGVRFSGGLRYHF